jgi:hypothetical protein
MWRSASLPHLAILPEPVSSCFQRARTHSSVYTILGKRVSQKPFVSMLLGGGRWSEHVAVTCGEGFHQWTLSAPTGSLNG